MSAIATTTRKNESESRKFISLTEESYEKRAEMLDNNFIPAALIYYGDLALNFVGYVDPGADEMGRIICVRVKGVKKLENLFYPVTKMHLNS